MCLLWLVDHSLKMNMHSWNAYTWNVNIIIHLLPSFTHQKMICHYLRCIYLVQVWPRTEVLCTPSSTRPRFELITFRSWITFHFTEMPVLTTWSSVTSRTEVLCTPKSTRRGSNSWLPDHDSTFHVTETPALTTRPSVTMYCQIIF